MNPIDYIDPANFFNHLYSSNPILTKEYVINLLISLSNMSPDERRQIIDEMTTRFPNIENLIGDQAMTGDPIAGEFARAHQSKVLEAAINPPSEDDEHAIMVGSRGERVEW